MSGLIGDKLQISYGLQKKTVLRLFNTLGFIIPMIAVIGLMFVKSHIKCLYKYVLFKEIILIIISNSQIEFDFFFCLFTAGLKLMNEYNINKFNS